jgi:competence protein ComEA
MKHLVRSLPSIVPILCAVAFLSTANLAAAKGKDWITLENCQLVPNRSNDGDSFHIRANDTEYVVRLYFVDAPETGGIGSPERLIEQAGYFGVSVPQVIEIGQNAKLFVQAKLAEPFTVVTRLAAGLGHSNIPRISGFVKTNDGDLGEQLIANGLARIHGKTTTPPGMSRAADEIQRLEQLEQAAKQNKLGGWAVNPAKTASSAAEGKVNPISIVAQPTPQLFTPALTPVRAAIATTPAVPVSSVLQASGKLDVNTATKDQLERIPGIGSTLAERIIAARPFKSADDLKNVKGVGGGKRFEEVRPFFK